MSDFVILVGVGVLLFIFGVIGVAIHRSAFCQKCGRHIGESPYYDDGKAYCGNCIDGFSD